MSDPTRQHYQMATGKGLSSSPSKDPSPGLKKGGQPSAKQGKKAPAKTR